MAFFQARLKVKLCLADSVEVLMEMVICLGTVLFLHWSQFVKILNVTS